MAASINNELGLCPTLMEGHNGIFEVTVNNNLLYTNRASSNKFPVTATIIQEISKYTSAVAELGVAATENPDRIPAGDGNNKLENSGDCCGPGCSCSCNDPNTTLNPIAVCSLLPQLDCNKCGYATCKDFTESLIRGDSEPEDCTPLMDPRFTSALFKLQKVMEGR